ncbi:MAG TPA: LacI family DNA-binding transcriptional regulator [Actinomycetota bacterium]|nr:LacI family DNA-binding transcriptional regulator [Actinomycetota bacterium]
MADRGRRRPTILDVARLAGVSKSTVSNVVRGLPSVSPETRRRVRRAIDRLGYRPNVLARDLARRRTTLIGALVSGLADPFSAALLGSLERAASVRGYGLLVAATEARADLERERLDDLLRYRVAGLLFLASSGDPAVARELRAQDVPAVFISCRGTAGDAVVVDDVRGGLTVATHLLALGHTRIAYVSGHAVEASTDRARLAGLRRGLTARGLQPTAILPWRLGPDGRPEASAVARIATLLARRGGPTAVVCANDACAIDVLDLADRLGLAVPARLSVVGFDDIPLAGLARISLTTVAQPLPELARLGIGRLIDRIEGRRQGPPEVRLLEPRLVRRATTGPAPA